MWGPLQLALALAWHVGDSDAGQRSVYSAAARGTVERSHPPADDSRPFCQNWYNGRQPNCYRTGLFRVHQAMEDENCAAALQSPESAHMVGEKIRKLKDESAFVFLRGTAALFYYDMFCEDRTFVAIQSNPHLFVVSNGDSHPENFGTIMMANGNMSFRVNDFDQALRAPFTWDLKRGAVAYVLACKAKGYSSPVCRRTVDLWLQGYRDVVTGGCQQRNTDRLVEGAAFLDRPDAVMVRNLITKVRRNHERNSGRRRWLAKKVDLAKLQFLQTNEVKLLPRSMIPIFQGVVRRYLYSGVTALVMYPIGHKFWRVLSVARKLGSGTGSLGLDRYWILINGENNEPRILDMKQVTTGVMERYLNQHLTDFSHVYRVMSMIKESQRFENIFFGVATYNDRQFIIKERSSFKASVSVMELDEQQFLDYAYITGRAQAAQHVSYDCRNAECPLEDDAALDRAACVEVAREFEKEPSLQRSIAEISFHAALRHIAYHSHLQQAFATCPELEQEPVLFLSRDVYRCENISEYAFW